MTASQSEANYGPGEPASSHARPKLIVARIPSRYRNFKVVSANRANTSEAIQKRTMILDSDQPISSKWWCSGAILKMRFLRSL